MPLTPGSAGVFRGLAADYFNTDHHNDTHEDEEDNSRRAIIPTTRRGRRSTDPSSDRPLVSRRRPRSDTSPDSDPEEDVIEVLPDRFDASGRPLDPRDRASVAGGGPSSGRMLPHVRRGDFVYRSPRGASGWNVRGQWGVAGTDPEAVERIVRNVTGAIDHGRSGWLGLLGGLLSGSASGRQGRITEGADRGRDEDDGGGPSSSSGRRKGRHARARSYDEYAGSGGAYDSGDDDRKRRRRGRRERDEDSY
jgi:hypothetical protein